MKNLIHISLLLMSGWLCAPAFAQDAPKPTQSAVRGSVVYADTRQPVRRAQVYLSSTLAYSLTRRTVTADDGTFALTNIGAGDYYLYADAPGLVSAPKPAPPDKTDAPAKGEEETESPNKVTLDGTNQLGITLTLTRGATLSGCVKYEDGEPVVEVKLLLYRQTKKGLARMYLEEERAVTDDRGHYALKGLPAGEYLVALLQPREAGSSYAPHDEDLLPRSSIFLATYPVSEAGRDKLATVKLEVGTAVENADLTINTETRRRIAGRVTWQNGKALGGAAVGLQFIDAQIEQNRNPVYLWADEGVSFDSQRSRLRTGIIRKQVDESGFWAVEDLRPGRYRLSVLGVQEEKQTANAEGEAAEGISFASDYQEINVENGDAENIVSELKPGPSVSGTARLSSGKPFPIAAVRAFLQPVDEEAQTHLFDSFSQMFQAQATDSQGGFIFQVLRPGRYRLQVLPRGRLHLQSAMLNGLDVRQQPLSLSTGQQLTGLQLVFSDEAGTLRGRLRTPGGQPIPNVRILAWPATAANPLDSLQTSDYDSRRTSQQDGTFQLDLPPDDYFVAPLVLEIGADNLPELFAQLRSIAQRVTLRANQTQSIELIAKPPVAAPK